MFFAVNRFLLLYYDFLQQNLIFAIELINQLFGIVL